MNDNRFHIPNHTLNKPKSVLPAFTIVEVLVSMLISGIVIATALTAYMNIKKISSLAFSQNQQNDNLILLWNAIEQDKQTAKYISSGANTLHFIKSSGKKVTYVFFDNTIIRKKDNMVDTIPLPAHNFKVRLLPENNSIVHRISFDVIIGKSKYPFNFQKTYGPAMYLNNKIK